ncbi:NADH dehydrogenase [ubiquinone] iron-sulfur protein 6, mitochondrial [Myotis brandtii]|uniref:NADH dehydrogenase [ubiquinone] iron-sulfur protein 6, mitochondrial n=1 Tax=Myotis brandtii TaxID=109478 RepID=S7MGN1_MYOBR|nr:NADH dehydrogenase [ubiquinone] iron-sulfur protein 6, mitochondrial [Myotis brandtii]
MKTGAAVLGVAERLKFCGSVLELRNEADAGVAVDPCGAAARWTPDDRLLPWLESRHVYDDKDYRKIRFVGRQKEVNENFAIDLIAEQPVSEVESRIVSCDGGGGALGHPKVYINLVM